MMMGRAQSLDKLPSTCVLNLRLTWSISHREGTYDPRIYTSGIKQRVFGFDAFPAASRSAQSASCRSTTTASKSFPE
eukprot:551207-Pyramimonas_sp.AAC.1